MEFSDHSSVPEEIADLFDDANGDLALGDLDLAIEKYRECARLAPEFFDAQHALAMALMKNGQIPEAIREGIAAIKLNLQDQLAWSSLSLFYVRNHQIKEAEAAGAKAKVLSWGGKLDPAILDEMDSWPIEENAEPPEDLRPEPPGDGSADGDVGAPNGSPGAPML